jgi:deoxyribonuclease-1-like protein
MKKPLTLALMALLSTQIYAADKLSVLSWNVQKFGKKKAKNEAVMTAIADVIKKYDIIAIEEYQDKKGNAIKKLMSIINKDSVAFDYIVGDRVGAGTKEQFVFVYNHEAVSLDTSYTFADSLNRFTYDPFVAKFSSKAGSFDATFIAVHTKPDSAEKEVMNLEYVMKDTQEKTNEHDIVALGDFNAGGEHFDLKTATGLRDKSKYHWAIPDHLDTTTKSTTYALDRIVFQNSTSFPDFIAAGVDRFDQKPGFDQSLTTKVSDHYPVFVIFRTNNDKD